MSGTGFRFRTVTSPHRDRQFLAAPREIYRSHPLWVPPLMHSFRRLLNPGKNPFWKRARGRFWVARSGNRAVGRIGAILNPAHDEAWNEKAGFFGFFESVEDPEVSGGLLDAAAGWLRDHGAEVLRGPVSPSTNDECGVLVDGFDKPPSIMMPYTPPYYPALLEHHGLQKTMDMFAFAFSPCTDLPPKVDRLARAVQERHGIRLRTLDMKRYTQELELLRTVYNNAWAENWGFVPMTREEFAFIAAELRPVVWPEFILFAEADGETVAAAICVPDINPLLKKMNGRLLPFGFRHLLGWRRKVQAVRLLTVGVLPAYRARGVDALFYRDFLKTGREAGFTQESELGWILEANEVMVNTVLRFGGRRTKTLRIYEKAL